MYACVRVHGCICVSLLVAVAHTALRGVLTGSLWQPLSCNKGLALAHLLGVPICRKPGWQLQLTRPASVMEGSAVGVRLAYRSCGSIQPVSQPVITPPTVASTVVCLRDAWLAAESDWACKRVEEVLYSVSCYGTIRWLSWLLTPPQLVCLSAVCAGCVASSRVRLGLQARRRGAVQPRGLGAWAAADSRGSAGLGGGLLATQGCRRGGLAVRALWG